MRSPVWRIHCTAVVPKCLQGCEAKSCITLKDAINEGLAMRMPASRMCHTVAVLRRLWAAMRGLASGMRCAVAVRKLRRE